MSLWSAVGIATAYATETPVGTATTTQQHPGSVWSMLWLPLLLILVFYFLLIRPQSKRAKDHRSLVEAITVGDEVITTGGIIGRVARLKDNFVVLEVTRGTEM